MSLTADKIRQAFDALSMELACQHGQAEIIVVGGAALVLLFGARSTTRDAADAQRARIDWSQLPFPAHLSQRDLTVAAAITEFLAERAGLVAPEWTGRVGGLTEAVLLDPGLGEMPRTLANVRRHGPPASLKRNLIAGAEFLDVR
ncbi:MAG: hypothetical protein ACT4NL_06305 [Pseudomarimonas sp.]